jgi:hypothetical protein
VYIRERFGWCITGHGDLIDHLPVREVVTFSPGETTVDARVQAIF